MSIEREEDELERQLADGEITPHQYNEEMRELRRDYQSAAEEAAEHAYRNELTNW
jgi:hypothetical protein